MSLDNIQIPAIVLQEMYTNALIDPRSDNAPTAPAAPGDLSFLGENRKHIAIIVDHAGVIYLPDEELNFLLGILSACKLSMADVALLNCHKNPKINYTLISEQLASEKILLFGVNKTFL